MKIIIVSLLLLFSSSTVALTELGLHPASKELAHCANVLMYAAMWTAVTTQDSNTAKYYLRYQAQTYGALLFSNREADLDEAISYAAGMTKGVTQFFHENLEQLPRMAEECIVDTKKFVIANKQFRYITSEGRLFKDFVKKLLSLNSKNLGLEK